MPSRLRDYVQESGRAGRDGEPSEAIVVVCRPKGREREDKADKKKVERARATISSSWPPKEAAVERFISGKWCRRVVLDQMMDGRLDRAGCDDKVEEICDICRRQRDQLMFEADISWVENEDTGSGKGMEMADQYGGQVTEGEIQARFEQAGRSIRYEQFKARQDKIRIHQEVETFEQELGHMVGRCIGCFMATGVIEEDQLHRRDECPLWDKRWWDDMARAEEKWQKSMFTKGVMADHSGCFWCGMPQAICTHWEPLDNDQGRFKLKKDGLGFEAERVRLFRERTTRRNIEYRVEIIEDREGEGVGRRSGGQRSAQEGARRWKQNGSAAKNNKGEEEDEVIERVCEVVKTWTEVNHNEGKVVIYGGTIERVKKIAASLDCVGYWNKAGSAEDKARWMEEWRTSVGGKSGWIVATNALGLGVDVPDVRLVVHAGMPRRLRDFVQESGRGGRDGKRSESVVVVQSSWMKEQQEIWTKRREERDRGGDNGVSEEGAVSKQAYEWEEDVVEFVEGKECRREVLDREMDGFMGRVGCEVGEEERCDVCRERALRMEAQVSRRGTSWVSIQSEEEEELARAAAAVEADYERSKRSIQWAEMEQVARVMKEAEDAADFEAELDDWSGRCIRIAQKVAAIPGIAKNQDDLKNWILPPPTIQINPYIQAPRDDGLGCSHCQYVVRDKQQMQKHGRTEHGWVSRRKRGGQQQAVPDEQDAMLAVPWRDHVQCQQVCNWGHGKRWFEVGRNDERATQEEATDGEGDADHEANVAFFNMVQEEGRKAFEDEASGRRVQDIDDKNEAHQWLGRCGWPRHLEGIRIDRLRTLLEPISDDEPVLQRMWEVLESVMDAAYQATARQCYPGTAELFEIARKEAHMTTTKPFQGLMEPDAWVRYKSWWKQLLCIWKRYDEWDAEDGYDNERFSNGGSSSSSSDSDSDTDTDSNSNRSAYDDDAVSRRYGPSDPRPPYKMTIQQEELWKAFDNGIRQVVTGADRAGRYTADRLQRSCLDAMVQFFDHPLKSGNHYESIVISALAVMGLDEGGGWKPVENYTSIYPAVIKVARYLVLYQSMLERQAQIDQLAQYATIRQAEEEAEGLFRIVRRKVRRFMIRIPEGEDIEPSPMNWIINTRTYGMHIRYSMPGSEMIEWHGDQISCNRVKIKMSEISDMLHAFIGDARQTLVQLATGGAIRKRGVKGREKRRNDGSNRNDHEDEDDNDSANNNDSSNNNSNNGNSSDNTIWPPPQNILPAIPWSRIEDRHGESALEHSFLQDEANQSWVIKGDRWVQKQVAASKAKMEAWIAKPHNEACPYREEAIRRYSRLIEEFRSQLFVAMHMLGGQPARSTEILGIRMWNTMNGGVRNIFIHDGMG
ncbi:hypothetical protein FPOA_12575 [Fusarium poae]|nr:hypothetical protein FPOA_12575 [Fusarium poae]